MSLACGFVCVLPLAQTFSPHVVFCFLLDFLFVCFVLFLAAHTLALSVSIIVIIVIIIFDSWRPGLSGLRALVRTYALRSSFLSLFCFAFRMLFSLSPRFLLFVLRPLALFSFFCFSFLFFSFHPSLHTTAHAHSRCRTTLCHCVCTIHCQQPGLDCKPTTMKKAREKERRGEGREVIGRQSAHCVSRLTRVVQFTNKPREFAGRNSKHTPLSERFVCVWGGDTHTHTHI